MIKDYYIVCPHCGFEYTLMCDETDFEENKDEILSCPCGGMAEIKQVTIIK